ncbi:hypothetical protein LR68_04086 [Anoxybacillus sp. BCO1]|nr:hypothetical protein LR68_04086 [Anoxybacillus sp. BCO1]
MKGICELCGRDDVVFTAHHLTPKEYGGTETAKLCFPCHKQIHALYTNEELASRYIRSSGYNMMNASRHLFGGFENNQLIGCRK